MPASTARTHPTCRHRPHLGSGPFPLCPHPRRPAAAHPGGPGGRGPPVVRREETSPNGEGSIRRYFCGEAAAAEAAAAAVAAAGEAVADAGADKGAHRLRFGDAGLSRGSKSRVLFRVAPHAMAAGSRGPARAGPGRTGAGGPSDAPGGCGARDGGAAAGQVGEARGSRRRLGAAPERPGHPRRALARSGWSAPRLLRRDRLPSEVDPARGATETRSPTRRGRRKLASGGDARRLGGGCGRTALGNALDPLLLHGPNSPPAAGPNMASITTPPIQILRLQGACAGGAGRGGPTRVHSGICGVSLRAGIRLKDGYSEVTETTTPVIQGARSQVPG